MRVLTFSLLSIWSGASFSIIFFARELSGLSLFGWPVSFYMAAQGSILIYLLYYIIPFVILIILLNFFTTLAAVFLVFHIRK